MTDESLATSLIHSNDHGNPLTSKSATLAQNEESVPSAIDFDFREQFDNLKSPHHLANQLQDVVDTIIQQCPDVDWNEDFLSRNVVQAIRRVLDGYILPNIEDHTNVSKFDIEAYKITGKLEQMHGDIAIVVSRSLVDGNRSISGVGFYEAKASALNGWGYPAFSFQQLRRLVTSTPKLSYLLYDKVSRPADSQEWPILPNVTNDLLSKNQVHARTVDANLLKQYKHLDDVAHFLSQSFGYHFVQRILSGRELDYSRPPLETIRRWLKVTRRTTALVVSIAIREKANDPIYAQLQLPGFEKLALQDPNSNDIYLLPNERPRLNGPNDAT